jgi:sugar lactone lactonase YvrE
MSAAIFDDIVCSLGEGPLWHPSLGQLFWFDINAMRLYTRGDDATRHWQFDQTVSAAGWIDDTTLLIATDTGLIRFDLSTGASSPVVAIEADSPTTRCNDGRADPFGGFWIGTMGRRAEKGAGSIYRYYRGELRTLFDNITITNAICFSPDHAFAYFADTHMGRIWRQRLNDTDGWPEGEPIVYLDLSSHGLNPDGAVVDQGGNVWIAQWGAYRVAAYAPDGRFVTSVPFPAAHISCPAFGGTDLATLFATSATDGLSAVEHAAQPQAGKTFVTRVSARGQAEHQVIL